MCFLKNGTSIVQEEAEDRAYAAEQEAALRRLAAEKAAHRARQQADIEKLKARSAPLARGCGGSLSVNFWHCVNMAGTSVHLTVHSWSARTLRHVLWSAARGLSFLAGGRGARAMTLS